MIELSDVSIRPSDVETRRFVDEKSPRVSRAFVAVIVRKQTRITDPRRVANFSSLLFFFSALFRERGAGAGSPDQRFIGQNYRTVNKGISAFAYRGRAVNPRAFFWTKRSRVSPVQIQWNKSSGQFRRAPARIVVRNSLRFAARFSTRHCVLLNERAIASFPFRTCRS